MGMQKYRNGFELTIHPEMVDVPLKWKKPSLIFVNSMSDLFCEDIPFSFIEQVFNTMNRASHHIFQVLTKRSQRLAELAPKLRWTSNIWMGVTVELSEYYGRIDDLITVPAEVRFISLEPMLGPMPNLPLEYIDWVIVGGESGPKARKMEKEWVYDVFAQCREVKIPFFFKQWGGKGPKKGGKELDGKIYHEYPPQINRLRQPNLI